MSFAKTRVNRSAGPPAAKVMTIFTGRDGNDCGAAAVVHSTTRPNAARNARRSITLLPVVSAMFRGLEGSFRSFARQQALVRNPVARQYECTAEGPTRGTACRLCRRQVGRAHEDHSRTHRTQHLNGVGARYRAVTCAKIRII